MRLLFASVILAAWVTVVTSSAQETGKGLPEPVERFVRIMAVKGNRMTVSESAQGRGMRGQTDGSSPGRSGRRRAIRGGMQNSFPGNKSGGRRGRGRFGAGQQPSDNQRLTISVGDEARITFALQERRTNEFRVGTDINGRLQNVIFKNLPAQGLPARIVSQGSRLLEVNIIQDNDTSTNDIAVKPKRPPKAR